MLHLPLQVSGALVEDVLGAGSVVIGSVALTSVVISSAVLSFVVMSSVVVGFVVIGSVVIGFVAFDVVVVGSVVIGSGLFDAEEKSGDLRAILIGAAVASAVDTALKHTSHHN